MVRFVTRNELHEVHSSTYEAAQELKALGSKILAAGIVLEETSKFACEKLDIPAHLILMSTVGAINELLRDEFLTFIGPELSDEAVEEIRDAFDDNHDAALGYFEFLRNSSLADVTPQQRNYANGGDLIMDLIEQDRGSAQPGQSSGGDLDGGTVLRAPEGEEREIIEAILRGIFPNAKIVRDDSIGGYRATPFNVDDAFTGTDD